MNAATRHRTIDSLSIEVHPTAQQLGAAAAAAAATTLKDAIAARGRARAIFATGNSQLSFFEALRHHSDVDWSRVEAFHMDEYLGLAADHPASFRAFLAAHLLGPLGIGTFHGIEGDPTLAEATMADYAARLTSDPIDLCCMGIGENGHLAFNDPPEARFDDPAPLRVVALDDASRHQQVGEGHFPDFDSVPSHAITLTIPTLLSAQRLLVIAPETRKAAAVGRALAGPIEPSCPASILRQAPHATLYLDTESAARLPNTDQEGG